MEFSDSEDVASPEDDGEEREEGEDEDEEGSDPDADLYKDRSMADRLRKAVSANRICFYRNHSALSL